MNALSRTSLLVIVFAAGGLIGPAVQWITWPPSKLRGVASEWVASIVSDVVFLLWPTQMLAVTEGALGRATALALALVANVLLFAAIGLAAARFALNVRGYVTAYIIVAVLIVLLALWGAGFSAAQVGLPGLVVTLVIYGTLFYIASAIAMDG